MALPLRLLRKAHPGSAEVKGWVWGLVRLLEKRVGPVSEALRARLYAADLASIQAWLDRAIEATEFNLVDLS